MERAAVLSVDRVYRYSLSRCWGDETKRCCFVGLNPSTADETQDDPTIRKCIGFATRWGFGAIDMVNLFAFRSTDQTGLLSAEDPEGPDNRLFLRKRIEHAQRVVWAWGRGKTAAVRRLIDERIARSDRYDGLPIEIGNLGTTDDGYPRHPLMLAYDTPFQTSQKERPTGEGETAECVAAGFDVEQREIGKGRALLRVACNAPLWGNVDEFESVLRLSPECEGAIVRIDPPPDVDESVVLKLKGVFESAGAAAVRVSGRRKTAVVVERTKVATEHATARQVVASMIAESETELREYCERLMNEVGL